MEPGPAQPVVDLLIPRPREDGGAALIRLLEESGDAYDLCDTSHHGVNALWYAATLWDRGASMREVAALLKAARGFSLSDPADLPTRMLVHCVRPPEEKKLVMVKPDPDAGFVMPAAQLSAEEVPGAAAACAGVESRLRIPVYAEESLGRPAWRWVMERRKVREAANALELPVAVATWDNDQETTEQSPEYELFVTASSGEGEPGAATSMSVATVAVSIELRFCLGLSVMHPSARRMAFSGLWMACRAGNVELLDLLLREGTPWAAVVRRAFTARPFAEYDSAEAKFEIYGECVVGEVWRELNLPQRYQTVGQAALMSASRELVELLEARVGVDAFWEGCLFVEDQGMVNEHQTYQDLTKLGVKLAETGLLQQRNKGAGSEAASADCLEAAKRRRVEGSTARDVENSGVDSLRGSAARRWYAWGIVQALAVHVHLRESERPLTGSVTSFVRNARGDLDETERDLHGPDVLKRSVEVLKLVVAARDRDEILKKSSYLDVVGCDALGLDMAIVVQRFALPFCFAVESGNQPAFEWACGELEGFVDEQFELDIAKLNGPAQGGRSDEPATPALAADEEGPVTAAAIAVERPHGLKLCAGAGGRVKASDLVKGLLAEFPLGGEGRFGMLRSTLWFSLVAPWRFAKECKNRDPQWGGAVGVGGGGPDPNAFPREFETMGWMRGVFCELVRCVSALHPHMMGVRSFDEVHVWLDGSECDGGGANRSVCSQVAFPFIGTKLVSRAVDGGGGPRTTCGLCSRALLSSEEHPELTRGRFRKETFTDLWLRAGAFSTRPQQGEEDDAGAGATLTPDVGAAVLGAAPGGALAGFPEAAWFLAVREWIQSEMLGSTSEAPSQTASTRQQGYRIELFWGSVFSRLFSVHCLRGIKRFSLGEAAEFEADWGYALNGFTKKADK